MTQQIAVRLPDDLAAQVDRIAGEHHTDRTSFIVAALRREVRREEQLRDVAILQEVGEAPYPDLTEASGWTSSHPLALDD